MSPNVTRNLTSVAARQVKPLTEATVKAMVERERIREELDDDRSIVLSGKRLLNRPGNPEKAEFIARSVQRGDVDQFPFIESDIADELETSWAWDLDPASTTIQDVVTREVRQAFRLAGEKPPLISNVHALTIMSSEVDLKIARLEDVPSAEIDLPLVLAHLLSLGFGWSKRVTIGVARRITVILMNKHMWSPGWPCHYDDPNAENESLENATP